MKTLLGFGAGIIVGVILVGGVSIAPLTRDHTKEALKTVAHKVEQLKYDQCMHKFNERTHCRQNKSFKPQECDALLDAECGPALP